MERWKKCWAAAAALLIVLMLLAGCTATEPVKKEPAATEEETGLGSLGIILREEDNSMIVLAVMQDSLAQKSGLKPGDLLVSVEGTSLQQISALEELLNTSENSSLKLVISRNSQELELELKLKD